MSGEERAPNGSAPRVPCPKECGRHISRTNLSKHVRVCGVVKPKKDRKDVSRDSYQKNRPKRLSKQREMAAFKSYQNRADLRQKLQQAPQYPTVAKPAIRIPDRSIFSSLRGHPEVAIALCKLIVKKAKPSSEGDMLTKEWLRELIRHTHVDKCQLTLQPFGVSREHIAAAIEGLTEYSQRVLAYYKEIDELTMTRRALIEGNIRSTISEIFTRLVPLMVAWEEEAKKAKKKIDSERRRLQGYLKRYTLYVDCTTWEQYRDRYIQLTGNKKSTTVATGARVNDDSGTDSG